ncbi:MAG: histidinol-phosphate aminotransferase family protein [Calditrichae bacterium]|nr:histidinol-phosphate aminotransferase family protein [Calditrichia bacterium]
MEQKMIYLDRNENNYGPAPKCFEVLKNADLTKLSYYTRAHEKGFKSILTERLASDLNVSREQILLGYGAEDLLKQAVQCFLSEGKNIMIPSYSWWYYKELASEANGSNIEYPIVVGEDTFYYDVDKMLQMYEQEKPEMVLISSPNNPTGNSLANEDLFSILKKMRETVVILDQAYLSYSNPINIAQVIKENPNLIVIRTFSKYYALAGMRIGYAVVGENLSALSTLMNRYLGYHRLSENIAIAALDSADYYANIYDRMKEDKELYFNELAQLPGFNPYKSDANFMLVKIPKEIMTDLNTFLKNKGLVIKFMNEPVLNSHLRITIGTREENKMVIEAIKEFHKK